MRLLTGPARQLVAPAACASLPSSRRSFHSGLALREQASPRSEKVERLTAEIASLTLLEAADLTESLKVPGDALYRARATPGFGMARVAQRVRPLAPTCSTRPPSTIRPLPDRGRSGWV
jgi:hypothetical protein